MRLDRERLDYETNEFRTFRQSQLKQHKKTVEDFKQMQATLVLEHE